MTAASNADIVPGWINRGLAARVSAGVSGGALQIILVVVALLWLLPTFGLLIESLRGATHYADGGWWQAIAHPEQLTWSNYSSLLKNHSITSSFVNTIKITVPAPVLVVLIGSAAGYAFAWMEFPGRDWIFIAVVALLVVPIQIALI